ncbi:hypothetical protein K7G98_18055, partial [Saccharothrix sp. MB29]|nr:hypothetical protein [Saccharothrix sp. MB29]
MGINPLASWADDARAGSEVMRVSAELQADYISKARSDMPPPVPVTAEKPNLLVSAITTLIGGQTDYELQEKASNAAEQRAREVMTTYASSTTSNTNTLGQFHQPPQLVISAGDAVRNDAPACPVPVGPRWRARPRRLGRRPRLARRRWRPGGRGSTPAVRPRRRPVVRRHVVRGFGAVHRADPPVGAALATGPGTGSFRPGGVIGGGGRRDEDKRRSDVTTTEQHAAGSGGGAGGAGSGAPAGQHSAAPPGAPLPAGTTSTSSADFARSRRPTPSTRPRPAPRPGGGPAGRRRGPGRRQRAQAHRRRGAGAARVRPVRRAGRSAHGGGRGGRDARRGRLPARDGRHLRGGRVLAARDRGEHHQLMTMFGVDLGTSDLREPV